MLKSFSKGEVHDLTSLIYDAREHAIGLITEEANAIGADDVVGIKTHIHEIGGLLEFMAIGTAVKRCDGIATQTDILPPQAIIKDHDTWGTTRINSQASSLSRRIEGREYGGLRGAVTQGKSLVELGLNAWATVFNRFAVSMRCREAITA